MYLLTEAGKISPVIELQDVSFQLKMSFGIELKIEISPGGHWVPKINLEFEVEIDFSSRLMLRSNFIEFGLKNKLKVKLEFNCNAI